MSQGLQQKEREENQLKFKLQNEQHVLISKLVELGATGYLDTLPSSTSPAPSSSAACVEMSPQGSSPKEGEQARRTQRASLRKDHIVGELTYRCMLFLANTLDDLYRLD